MTAYDTFEIIVSFVITLFALSMGAITTYLTINTLVNYFREKKSDPARTLTRKEIENISLFLFGFAASVFWMSVFSKLLIERLGGK